MKTNDNSKGGQLQPEFYKAYAQYLVKYLKAMKSEGIPIDAITIQNEPLNHKNTPSMVMSAEEEAIFLKSSLGPQLNASDLTTKVILYDHNCDRPEYALAILADSDAAQYADGSGFHLYGGPISAMSKVHDAYPDKNPYFTEQMVIDKKGDTHLSLAAPVARIVIGATQNWSRNVLLWNLAADPHNGSHTSNGGCPICEGAITLDGDHVTRNVAYYTIAHALKFVPPGSYRIQSISTAPPALAEVAFKTLKGKHILFVANTDDSTQAFDIRYRKKIVALTLSADAVATYVW